MGSIFQNSTKSNALVPNLRRLFPTADFWRTIFECTVTNRRCFVQVCLGKGLQRLRFFVEVYQFTISSSCLRSWPMPSLFRRQDLPFLLCLPQIFAYKHSGLNHFFPYGLGGPHIVFYPDFIKKLQYCSYVPFLDGLRNGNIIHSSTS